MKPSVQMKAETGVPAEESGVVECSQSELYSLGNFICFSLPQIGHPWPLKCLVGACQK